MERVEIEMASGGHDTVAIRKVGREGSGGWEREGDGEGGNRDG